MVGTLSATLDKVKRAYYILDMFFSKLNGSYELARKCKHFPTRGLFCYRDYEQSNLHGKRSQKAVLYKKSENCNQTMHNLYYKSYLLLFYFMKNDR